MRHRNHPECLDLVEEVFLQDTTMLDPMSRVAPWVELLCLFVRIEHCRNGAVTNCMGAHLPARFVGIDDEPAKYLRFSLEEPATAFTNASTFEWIKHGCGSTDQRSVRENFRAADAKPLVAKAGVNSAVKCKHAVFAFRMRDVMQGFNRYEQIRAYSQHPAPPSLHPRHQLDGAM